MWAYWTEQMKYSQNQGLNKCAELADCTYHVPSCSFNGFEQFVACDGDDTSEKWRASWWSKYQIHNMLGISQV